MLNWHKNLYLPQQHKPMSFNYSQFDLPITEVIPEIKESLEKSNTLILNAPPGAGKSTLLPLALFEEAWLKGQKIIMLEPRRLAAKTIAKRLADLLGEQVGDTVGYRIRFETKVSSKTRIEIVTEGIVTRMLQSDSELVGVAWLFLMNIMSVAFMQTLPWHFAVSHKLF